MNMITLIIVTLTAANVERFCFPDEFQCGSGVSLCISKTQVCDGIPHCPDRSDEMKSICQDGESWSNVMRAQKPISKKILQHVKGCKWFILALLKSLQKKFQILLFLFFCVLYLFFVFCFIFFLFFVFCFFFLIEWNFDKHDFSAERWKKESGL